MIDIFISIDPKLRTPSHTDTHTHTMYVYVPKYVVTQISDNYFVMRAYHFIL